MVYGALGSPEIFSEVLGLEVKETRFETLKRHIDMLRGVFPERFINGHIRKHLLWYLKGFVGAASIKAQVSTEPDLDKVLVLIKDFMESQK